MPNSLRSSLPPTMMRRAFTNIGKRADSRFGELRTLGDDEVGIGLRRLLLSGSGYAAWWPV
jgi:hypothetical protein